MPAGAVGGSRRSLGDPCAPCVECASRASELLSEPHYWRHSVVVIASGTRVFADGEHDGAAQNPVWGARPKCFPPLFGPLSPRRPPLQLATTELAAPSFQPARQLWRWP